MKRLRHIGLFISWLLGAVVSSRADNSFTNLLEQAAQAGRSGNLASALKLYDSAENKEVTNSANLCTLAHRYCDLMFLTNSVTVKKDLAARALTCSQQAVRADPNNATAHACLAVCYGKLSEFADIKSKLNYSKLLKLEAERAIALDPNQDIGYYLLGRWNYGVANIGFFSRTFVRLVYGEIPAATNDKAITEFKKAIHIAPNRIIHHAGLAMVYGTIGERTLQITELRKCCHLKPTGLEDEEAQHDAIKELNLLDPTALK